MKTIHALFLFGCLTLQGFALETTLEAPCRLNEVPRTNASPTIELALRVLQNRGQYSEREQSRAFQDLQAVIEKISREILPPRVWKQSGEDFTSDIMEKILRSADTKVTNPFSWVYTIAVNHRNEMYRREKRSPHVYRDSELSSPDSDRPSRLSEVPSKTEGLHGDENGIRDRSRAEITEILGRMPDKKQRALLEGVAEGKTLQEIGQELGMTSYGLRLLASRAQRVFTRLSKGGSAQTLFTRQEFTRLVDHWSIPQRTKKILWEAYVLHLDRATIAARHNTTLISVNSSIQEAIERIRRHFGYVLLKGSNLQVEP